MAKILLDENKNLIFFHFKTTFNCGSHGCSYRAFNQIKDVLSDTGLNLTAYEPLYLDRCYKNIILLVPTDTDFSKWQYNEGHFTFVSM